MYSICRRNVSSSPMTPCNEFLMMAFTIVLPSMLPLPLFIFSDTIICHFISLLYEILLISIYQLNMCEPFIFHLSVPSSHKLSIFLSFSFSISLSLCLSLSLSFSHSLSPSASLSIFLPSLFSYLSLSIPPFLTLPLHFMKHILISTARSYFLHYHSSSFRLNLPPSILLFLTLSFSSFYLFFL